MTISSHLQACWLLGSSLMRWLLCCFAFASMTHATPTVVHQDACKVALSVRLQHRPAKPKNASCAYRYRARFVSFLCKSCHLHFSCPSEFSVRGNERPRGAQRQSLESDWLEPLAHRSPARAKVTANPGSTWRAFGRFPSVRCRNGGGRGPFSGSGPMGGRPSQLVL